MATGPITWGDAFSDRALPEPTPAPPPPGGRPRLGGAEFGDAEPRPLRDYLRVLRRQRRLAAACFGVTVALAILAALFTPRAYTAATRLQVARKSSIQLP